MINKQISIALLLAVVVIFTGCDKDDPVIVDPPELITTLIYTLTPNGGGDTVTLTFRDLDGDGGNAAVVTGGTLATNQSYSGSLDLLNESVSPAESITEEIEEEDDEHQFFFQSSISDISVAYNDADMDGNPLGLSSTLTTGEAATGNITIILRHMPEKFEDGVADGDITNADGESDIEVTFPIDVQ